MTGDDRAAHWDSVYGTKAEREVSWFEASPAASLALIARTGFGPDAAIVDIGAGRSTLPDALLAAGYRDVTLVDVSRTALDQVRARLADRVSYVVTDIARWTPPRAFDVWHDRAVLHFLTAEDDRDGYRRALFAGTRPGSQVILSTFAPSGPEQCSGLPVRRYGRAEVADFLGPEFEIVESFESDHRTPWDAVQRFHTARAVRL